MKMLRYELYRFFGNPKPIPGRDLPAVILYQLAGDSWVLCNDYVLASCRRYEGTDSDKGKLEATTWRYAYARRGGWQV
jgi:hypothetical protein